jgi:hypothetical protein
MVEMLDARAFVPFTRQFQQHETDATGLTLYNASEGELAHCSTAEPCKASGLKPGSNCAFAT